MKTIQMASLAVVLATLTACSDKPVKTLSADFGNAVRQNMAAHIINPAPSSGTAVSPMNGARAGAAVGNYRTGNDPKVERVLTTKVLQ